MANTMTIGIAGIRVHIESGSLNKKIKEKIKK